MAPVFCLLYFLLFLKPPPPTFATTDRCFQSDLSVTNTTDLQPALTTESQGVNFHYQESYFHPLEGFKGVSLDIEWSNKSSSNVPTSYFQGHEHCFDARRWWRVVMGCDYDKKHQTIRCYMRAGDCYWHCYKNYTALLDKPWVRLHWAAHGSSRWRSTPPPEGCPRQDSAVSPSHEDYPCMNSFPSPPPATTTTTNARHPLSPLGVLVMVSFIVVYWWW